MKLSLIEPFALRPAIEEGAEEGAREISREKKVLSGVDTHLGGDNLTDTAEDEVSRGFTRFVDFLAKQKAKKQKSQKVTKKQRKGLQFYGQLMHGDFREAHIGQHVNENV